MSERSASLENDFKPRKRQLSEASESDSPSKRVRQSTALGFLLTPFTSLIGMFGSKKSNSSSEHQAHRESEDEEVVVVATAPKKKEHVREIIFLNSSNTTYSNGELRLEAGNEENEVVDLPKPNSLVLPEDDDIVVEQYLQKTLEVSDEDEEDVEEIGRIQKTPEKVDEDIAVEFVKIVKTPNRDLQNARKFQNQIIFLNSDTAEDADAEVELREPFDSTNPQTFASPTPDESASRPWTPNDTFASSYTSSNNIRDYWRRSAKKNGTGGASLLKRAPIRHIQRIGTSAIQKPQKTSKKQQIAKDSLNKYKERLIACGYILAESNLQDEEKKKRKAITLSASDLIAKARNAMAGIEAESRSGTPSVISRESSILSDRPERTPAGAGRDTSSKKASTSSFRLPSSSSSSRIRTPSSTQITDMLNLIEDLDISTKATDKLRYQSIYEQNRLKEESLLEEMRIRDAHRTQTRDERYEDVRSQLAVKGIIVKPKLPVVVKDEFPELPDETDQLINRVIAKGEPEDERFADAFGISIDRKDLLTLHALNWLNDNIINYYLQLICERSQNESGYPKVYAFNTFFYTNVVTKGYVSVKRWTRKTDIFSYDVLLVPVHLGMHWCMAVIDITEKRVEFYDSLYNGNTTVLPALRGYLLAESLDKKKVPLDLTGWTMRQMEDIPRQQNGSDCGVFSCQFGEWAARRKPVAFTQKHMPYYRRRMTQEICTRKLLATI